MPEWATFPSVEDWAWVLGCGQRNDAWPEDWSLSLIARSSARFRVCRCFSAQVSHLVWSGTVGFGQSLQMPSFLASSRLAWAMRRRSSLRSGVWRLFRSYFRRFSSLASTCAGVGSTRGLGVLGVRSFGTTFLGGFLTYGFCGGFRVGGLLFLFFWTDRSMVY